MPAQSQHQAYGKLVVIATGKTDDVNVLLALGDGVGDVTRALDRVDDQHDVAHALAAVGTLVTGPCFRRVFGHLTDRFGVASIQRTRYIRRSSR